MSSTLTDSFRAVALSLPAGSSLPVSRDWLLEVLAGNDAPSQSEPLDSHGATSAPLITVAEAAVRIGHARSFIYRKQKSLPFLVRVGSRDLRVDVGKLEKWIARRAVT